MASRRETAAKRQMLASTIRAQVESGEMSAGTMLPTVRALQAEHGLSASIVHEELRKLVADGLLISRPGVGFYVAEREVEDPDTFLMVLPADRDNFVWPEILDRTRLGFEAQITELGGATSVISVHAPLRLTADERPAGPIAGIFGAGAKDAGMLRGVVPDEVPRVRWRTDPRAAHDGAEPDTVAPDFAGAGRRAAEHLVKRGHSRIGFLGVHSTTSNLNHWSAMCESGWREVVATHGCSPDDLVFRATEATEKPKGQLIGVTEVARRIVARRDITAVVCASTLATDGLVNAMREADVPPDAWPAMVTVGDVLAEVSDFTTSIRIPHEDLGRAAAKMLWQRARGEYQGPARHCLVPMSIVRRADAAYAWLTAGAT